MPQPEKEDKLLRLLREKRGMYTISKDGYISMDMNNQRVHDSFKQRIDQVRRLVSEGKIIFK